MSGMKGARFGTRGTAALTFENILSSPVGSSKVGRRAVIMQPVGQKMTILGFTTLTGSGSVAKHFHRPGHVFTVPYEGEWNHFYFLFAYIWMNRIMNGLNTWNSVPELISGFRRGLVLDLCNWFPPFTETFDDCWREGAMKADRENRTALAKAVLGIFNRFGQCKIKDGDRLLNNTATVDASPRTAIFCEALENGRSLDDVMATLFPYYATIYAEEYAVTIPRSGKKTNEVTLMTKVEPWPRGVCQPGRKNVNRYVRKVFQKSADLQGAGTTTERAAGGGLRGGGIRASTDSTFSFPSTQPLSQPLKHEQEVELGARVEVFVPSEAKWYKATITKRRFDDKGAMKWCAVEYDSGATYSKVLPENIRKPCTKEKSVPIDGRAPFVQTVDRKAGIPSEPQVRVNEGVVPFIIGKATNTKGVKMDFRAMSRCVANGNTEPYYTFPDGGAGNNFRMAGGQISAGVIGAIGKSPKKNGTKRLCRVVVLDGGEEASVRGGAVTFHPLYVDSSGKARVQLVSKPKSVKVGQPFDVDEIKEGNSYVGCAGLCLNGKKHTNDGRDVSDLTWALQPCVAVN
jgi:hypothetical protein